jgi:glycerol dehydrogenase
MPVDGPYLPQDVFAPEGLDRPRPRVLIAPGRYIQGPGVLDDLGRHLSLLTSRQATLLISEGGRQRFGSRLADSLSDAGVEARFATFRGECSVDEVERVTEQLRAQEADVDALIGVGGGKTLDAGKCVAHRLSVPFVSCPTLASTDAPCSALSVMYTEEGAFAGVEYFPDNPAIVVVDTQVVADAPERYLVAGMGDAVATSYEARVCAAAPEATSVLGGRTTVAAAAIAEASASTVFEHGLAAVEAARRGEVTDALERVIEANTLLSGIGFESGGLAVAHAVASVLPFLPKVHAENLHGEMVAIGVLAQIVLEGDRDEARSVARMFATLGLPVHLEQLSLDLETDGEALGEVLAVAAGFPFVHNEPVPVTPETLYAALVDAHRLGLEVAAEAGDREYRALRKPPRRQSSNNSI